MTRTRRGSTLVGMRFRLLSCWLSLMSLGCEGGYVLGDAKDRPAPNGQGGEGDAGAGAVSGGASGASGSAMAGEGGLGGSGEASGLMLSPSKLPAARLNHEYVAQFAAQGGPEPHTFSIQGGQLPPGLTLEADGRLHGAPTAHGEFDFLVRATDAESESVEAVLRLSVSRVRWLATQTFPSSASTQTLLSLTDLLEPGSEPIRIESQSAHGYGFSPDGRWLIYNAFRSLEAVDWYIVDTASETPGERQFLLTNDYMAACRWSPKGATLLCQRTSGDARELVYFDASAGEIGPLRPLGAVSDRFAWADDDTLVYAQGDGPYSRVSWEAGLASEPEPLGVSGVNIERQSSDGRRAIATVNDSGGAAKLLLDLQTGESAPLPESESLQFSDDFSAAVSFAATEQDPKLATYRFYSVSGLGWSLVGETVAALHIDYSPHRLPLLGNRLVLVKDEQVSVTVIDDQGVEELVVPGAFSEVRSVAQSANGRWLYIETGQRNGNGTSFLPETIEHWLSRVEDEAPAQLVGAGFVASFPAFSPDSQRFRLQGYDSYSDEPMPFYLFDLSDPEQPRKHALDIPLNWAETSWSDDSSFVTFLGGSPTRSSRILFGVDALAPETAPRTIFECSSNPAPLPGCPNGVAFQP